MSRRSLAKLIIATFSLLLGLLALELAVRTLSKKDEDGEVRFRSTRLRPYQLPVRRIEKQIAEYQGSKQSSLIWDADLGWSQRPSVADHNDAGFITSGPTPPREKSPGKLRIACFGDSFTQSSYQRGWWRMLEQDLNQRGISAEVLNFGVGGYAMDQAYLRWHRDGAPWKPDIVIFGFFAEDCYRNLNTLRLLRDPDSGIPFMKPRFVVDGDGLRLIGSPTPSPEAVAEIVRNFAASPLASHEWFFHPKDFQRSFWRWSRLISLVEAKLELANDARNAEAFFRLGGEASEITLRLLETMRREVESTGARFMIVHMPGEFELTTLQETGKVPHQSLYEECRKRFEVVGVESAMLAAAAGKPVRPFFNNGHYATEFNAITARELAVAISATSEGRVVPR